ncbi:MAG TPA: DeoR/GlpR family DNA-binding transcription regulator [Roseiarcus sp.]|nr:DeoR/GlpR family DNA-binding transcription regulator [Roseiarcus sp.]
MAETHAAEPRPAPEKARVPAAVRHAFILGALGEVGAVAVADVAQRLGVSDMTIRRDLGDLERDGRLSRTHGGAVRAGAPEPHSAAEPTFESRLNKNALAKRAIAAAAAVAAQGAQAIALDVGTTTYWLAGLIAERRQAKIFTNSLRIAARLGDGRAEVYLPGGRLRGDEMSISGPSAIEQFETLWFDIAFLGVSGLTSEGVYDYSFDDAEMKRVYLRRATRKIALCDSSKFGAMSLVRIAPLAHFDALITDAAPPPDIAAALAAAGVAVEVAHAVG